MTTKGQLPSSPAEVSAWAEAQNRPGVPGTPDQKPPEETLRRRLRYEEMIADISSLALQSSDLDSFLEKCLGIIGRSLDLSRTFLFRHRHETDTMDNICEWLAPGITPQKENLQGVASREAPWWVDMMRNNRVINYDNVEEIPYELEREILKAQQIKSILAVPLFVKDTYYGFIGFDECRTTRVWPREDVALLRAVSEILVLGIEREQDRKALENNEALLRATIESLPFDLFVLDKNGRYSLINSTARRRWGEVAGRRPQDVAKDGKTQRHWLKNNEIAFSGSTVRGEFQYKIDGKERSMYNIISPVRNGNDINAIVGINIDITDRKNMEEEIRSSEKKYRDLVENMNEVIYTIDRNGKVTYVSPSIFDLIQYDVSEILNRYAGDFIHKSDLSKFEERIKSSFSENAFTKNEYRLLKKSGDIFWVQVSTRAMYVGGELVGFQGIITDIDKRKQAEEALLKSEALLSATEQLTKVGGWEYDTEKNVFNFTNQVFRIHDIDPNMNHIQSTDSGLMGHKHLENLNIKAFHSASQYCLNTGEPYDLEFPYTTIKGRHLWIRTTAQPVFESGKTAKVVGNIMDITERKRVEHELRQAKEELERRVRERTGELRQRAAQLARLSSKLTLSEQSERDRIAEILHDHIQQLLVAAKLGQLEMINLVDGTLRPEAERVHTLIDQSIADMRSLSSELSPPILRSGDFTAALKWLAKWVNENQGFEVDFSSEDQVHLDRKDVAVLLFQSIRELLLNVLKHAGVKSAELNMERADGDLHVVVKDGGVGFDPEALWRSVGDDQKFGLISIRERLLHLGGRLEIESAPGAGSTVSLIVPLDERSPGKGHTAHRTREILETSAPVPAGVGKSTDSIRVMLVDDHPVMREGFSRILSAQSGMEVVAEASDGEEAVRLAKKVVPDVILMDVSMPNMDGLEATRIISSEFPHIRIIGLSMHESDHMAAAMIQAGASAYRLKSESPARLLSAIRGEDPPGASMT